ncbi:unnamed protein product [Rhodiola kirilowii]
MATADGQHQSVNYNLSDKLLRRPMKILVVDDDYTCLRIVGGILETWKYQVELAENGVEALSYLYSEEGESVDAVVTDVHMPAMDGFELLKHVTADFPYVPVFMMSGDDKPHTMFRGLNSGAVLFMHKPVSAAELKNIWQFVYYRRRSDPNKPNVNHDEKFNRDDDGSSCGAITFKHSIAAAPAAMQIGEGTSIIAGTTHLGDKDKNLRMYSTKCVQDDIRLIAEATYNVPSAAGHGPRNPRLLWTAELHYKFLYALHVIGFEKATPKAIHEVMNVDGLMRASVASHLQKYRLFLKRAEHVANGEGAVFLRRSFMSTYIAGYVPLYYRLLHIDPTDQPRLMTLSQEDLTAMREPIYTVQSHKYNSSGLTNYSTLRLGSSNYYDRRMPSDLDSRLAATHHGHLGVTWNGGNHPMTYNKVEKVTDGLAQLQIDTPIDGFPNFV